jgi:hypothetical protein
MKKSFLLLLFVISFNLLEAQPGIPKQDTTWAYGEIVGVTSTYNKYSTVVVDISQTTSTWAIAPTLPVGKKAGKPQGFETMADALNYMSSQGWELYLITSAMYSQTTSEHHWIIRRKVVRNADGKFVPVE